MCFDKCVKGALAEDEIKQRADGTTNLKLEALPKIVSFVQFPKMTVTYSGDRPKLSVDRFAGTVNYSLGFTLDGVIERIIMLNVSVNRNIYDYFHHKRECSIVNYVIL